MSGLEARQVLNSDDRCDHCKWNEKCVDHKCRCDARLQRDVCILDAALTYPSMTLRACMAAAGMQLPEWLNRLSSCSDGMQSLH